MRRKTISKAKLIVSVESNKKEKTIETIAVFDNRTNSYWTDDEIEKRGIKTFFNMNDLKETLNWCLNGDDSKYQFTWGQNGKNTSDGKAYVYD